MVLSQTDCQVDFQTPVVVVPPASTAEPADENACFAELGAVLAAAHNHLNLKDVFAIIALDSRYPL